MKHLQWCQDIFQNKICQKHIEDKLHSLIDTYFQGKEQYAIEKLIKSFSEGLGYLEKLLLQEQKLNFEQFNQFYQVYSKAEAVKKYEEIENTIIREIDRQFRHYSIFLAAIKA